ncbi:hypothetical protein SAMN04488518_101105 [Pseudovibrio ascidiaceicola]|uniref:Uncharacterized protein n=1 Tax=Pseudovibrio ascidiaceicola TaxID=285279 RepID=A0A1I3UZ89_9HYPH|nr:hypothetical protein [Pseudovibrio ascidiaceicola]SFJ88210.1 hypothetical protein SAMN04488518_101105 [Pseudovibrio ascidiaceicola]
MNAKTSRIAELRDRLAVLEGRLPSAVQLAPVPASAQTEQGPAPLGEVLTVLVCKMAKTITLEGVSSGL